MNCKNCGKEIETGTRFCQHCGVEQNIESKVETSEFDVPAHSNANAENNSSIQFTAVGHKSFKSLSKGVKILIIAVPIIICLLIFFISIGDGDTDQPGFSSSSVNYLNDEETAMNCAITQIQKQVFAKDNSVYNVKVVDTDGCGRYIITATTKPAAFETWWVVLVQLNSDNETYKAFANYHGDGTVDAKDVSLLEQAGALSATINQSATSEELQTGSVYQQYIELIDQSVDSETPAEVDHSEQSAKGIKNLFETIKQAVIKILLYIKMALSILK